MIDLESGSRIVHMIAAAADSRWLLATRGGYGFAAKLSDMFSRQRAGKQFITLEAGDELLRPVPLFDGATQLALLSDKASSWCSAWTRSRVCREAAAARS